uniref:OSJNBa0080E14.5 protein n=1 Tax=Oryza sativa subsp. japonica TaxID=39947 RepID=Q7X836_ORYSJ|nr:OSJNBa0080E14.5 [Oryza sativa Japonica Group]
MSTSASPSIAPSAKYTEHLSNLVAIPSLSHEHHYFLGPIGNPDPIEFIIAETNRIPFRLANPNLANSAKDEPLMASAAYFWSNTFNAFLFNQGPMTPTLIDITMITVLDVTSSANPISLNTKNQFDFRTKSIGGGSGYVAAYMGKGSVTPREHTAFLIMWLKKFLFCGSSCGPTTNWQFLAEALETKRQFLLGKILLGYQYEMLSNASAKIAIGSVVGAGGPWWLLQTWLNLVVMKVVNRPLLIDAQFPRLEPITGDDGEELTHRRCMSYGEAASTPADSRAKLSAELLKDWFCSFYEGFQRDARIWFPYEDSVNFDLPADFRFEDINSEKHQKSREVFSTAISPCILPVGIHQGRNIQTTESSPPRKSNSGRDIEYAAGLLPNGGGLAPLVIGYHAPSTSSLLQGQMREPTDVGRKRKTKASAIDPSALAPKKKVKKHKPKPADDLPTLDPSIEQALDEEEIEEDIDQAAAELSDIGEKTPSASPKQTPPIPAAPAHFSRPPPPSPPVQQTSSDHTPSATGSHNVGEEEQPIAPAIPVLADLFSFDIKDYFDEIEEETTSKALAPLDETVKKTLEDISLRLESSLDNLVADCGLIRARFAEIQALIPDDLANTITLAVFLEQHQFKLEKAK